jgi:hypothetical protein
MALAHRAVCHRRTREFLAGGTSRRVLTLGDGKGDALTLTFESAVKTLHQIEVNTWLDEPENAVNLKVTMQALTDGLSYPGNIVFALPKRQIEVRITKSNYQKIAQ